MKRRFIFALILISAVGLIVHCGNGGSDAPDLEGVWEGTGWVDTEALGISMPGAFLAVEPLEPPVPCPSIDELVTIELGMDADGNPNDLLICGESIESILETDVTAVLDEADFDENVLWVLFHTTASEKDLYGGALVLDDSAQYAVLFLWDAQTDEDLFLGTVQRTMGAVKYDEEEMLGSWSGIAVDFEEEMSTIYYEKHSPLDVTLSMGDSLALSGTDPDGWPLSGTVAMEDTDYGYVEGVITALVDEMEIDFDLEGFVSPDGEFFGAALEEKDGSPFEWAIIGVTKEEVLE